MIPCRLSIPPHLNLRNRGPWSIWIDCYGFTRNEEAKILWQSVIIEFI